MPKTYREKLLDPRWQKKRLEILSRDNFICRLCGDSKTTLHVHHLRYRRDADPWDYPDASLLTACSDCHEALHGENFGAVIVEALIAGGATIGTLWSISTTLASEFTERPDASPLSADQWGYLIERLPELLANVSPGD